MFKKVYSLRIIFLLSLSLFFTHPILAVTVGPEASLKNPELHKIPLGKNDYIIERNK